VTEERKHQETEMDNELFEKAPIPKAYFSLAMPVVLSMLVTLVYSMVRISSFPNCVAPSDEGAVSAAD